MSGYLAISLIVLLAGTFITGLEFEEERRTVGRNYKDEFENWQGQFRPKGPTRRTAEGVSSSEEEDTKPNPTSSSDPDLDVDVISGPLGGGHAGGGGFDFETRPHPGRPNTNIPDFGLGDFDPTNHVFFRPSFQNPFFGGGNFGFGGGFDNNFNGLFPSFDLPQRVPWWRGPHVCIERKEEFDDWESNKKPAKPTESTDSSEESESVRDSTSITGNFGFHISLNSCVEKSHKRECKSITSDKGRKKTVTVIHQCCHGYGRKRSSEITNVVSPCEKLELHSVTETAEDLNAKEFIRAVQKNSLEPELKKNVTLFVPIDSAFTEFAEQMLESNLVVLPLKSDGSRIRRAHTDVSGINTKDIILSHIVPEWINIEDIENEQLLVSEFENSTIRMNIFPRPPSKSNDDDDEYGFRYTANCAPIVKANRIAENGVVHVIDRVLTPVKNTIWEIVRSRSDMAVLQTVLEKTNLSKLLDNAEKPLTLFAPTDKAFEKLDPHFRRAIKDGKGCALNILKNHILDLTFCSVAVVDDAKTTAVNVLGERMTLERTNKTSESSNTVLEVNDFSNEKAISVNGKAQITEADIIATNGVIHVIDTLLPTDSGMPVSTMFDSRNLTTFQKLVEANGFGDLIDSYENVSIFAPTDAAFEDNYWTKKLVEDPVSLKDNKELTEFLQYHIAKPLIKTCDLTERSFETVAGPKVRVNLYSTHSILSNIMNRATVNCARLVHFDDESCGSVLHQIDRPLEPPTQNLLQILESNEHYSKFVQYIKDAGLTDLLSNADKSLTILVPKNEIFSEVKDYFDELKAEGNKKKLEDVIKAHIIEDVLCCAGIVKSEWPFIRLVKTINDFNLRLGRDRRPQIQNAGITKCDIIGTNGIIHEVNDVINIKQQQRSVGSLIPSVHDSDDDSSEETDWTLKSAPLGWVPF